MAYIYFAVKLKICQISYLDDEFLGCIFALFLKIHVYVKTCFDD